MDEAWKSAIFQELGSCPAMAGKAADAVGLLPGHTVEVAVAEQAYIQAELRSDVLVEMPRNRQPEAWKNMRRACL